MTTATLNIPKLKTSIELSPELESCLIDAISEYRENQSDIRLSQRIQSNPKIQAHTTRIHSLHTAGKL